MRRVVVSVLVVVGLACVTGCQSQDSALTNRFGDCTFGPRAACTNQNLQALGLQSSDLTGADFSGSNMTHTDLRNAILRDAKLVGTNLSLADLRGADLRGADLSGAVLFSAKLENADWSGSKRSGARYCQTFLPAGAVSGCQDLDQYGSIVSGKAASIVTFEPHRPFICLNDAIGRGVEVDWRVKHATTVGFLVDGVHATAATGNHGIKRIPVGCDGERHFFTIQAFGAVAPLATESFVRVVPR